MKPLLYCYLLFFLNCSSKTDKREALYRQQAGRVTIIRDGWGIPHIYGKTDADAVFGVMYAQCEENFELVERAYIEKLGRRSAIDGKQYLLEDLKTQLLYDTANAIADYKKSPPWLKSLLQAFSDGIHYYLLKHPSVKPQLLTRFEPWYPLLFTDGAFVATQTGGLEAEDMKALFGKDLATQILPDAPATAVGSNGFALAPSRTADGSAMLYINPHVSFYFRTEMHMVSEEGLNAYGAVTWGQFFVFQGFNEHCGWMHTSTAVDASDLYGEKISEKASHLFYEHNGETKPLAKKQFVISYHQQNEQKEQVFETYATHHGPVLGMRNGNWLSLRSQHHSLNGLVQSWLRTKAKNWSAFYEVMQLRSNATTNTVYADKAGNIAYWHGNFVPRRSPDVNPELPMDGSTQKTEWQGLHQLEELVHTLNPKEGFVQNCNSSPFSVSGVNSFPRSKYPFYMAPEGENFRSLQAIRLLSTSRAITLDDLIQIGHNPYLAAFDTLLPPLLQAYQMDANKSPADPLLSEVIDSLRHWNRYASVSSVATTIGVLWAWTILSEPHGRPPNEIKNDQVKELGWTLRQVPAEKKVAMLREVVTSLKDAFGTWKIPWGDINRYQRLNGGAQFDNDKTSFPVGFGPAYLGSLPSFETVWHNNKQYGVAGNSFVAAVSFGTQVRAKAISTGGQSFSADNNHFLDQAERFVKGELRDVYFYKEDVLRHAEKTYHPGE